MMMKDSAKNKAWRNEKKKNGLCTRCGRKATVDGKVYCEECAKITNAYTAMQRSWYKAHKICYYCKTNTLFGDEKICPECAIKKNEGVKQSLEKNYGGAKNYAKERRERLKEQGICYQCGKNKVIESRVFCQSCLDKHRYKERRKYNRKVQGTIRRSERVSYGLCYVCGDPLDMDAKVCSKCYQTRLEVLGKVKRGGNTYWRQDNHLMFGGVAHG